MLGIASNLRELLLSGRATRQATLLAAEPTPETAEPIAMDAEATAPEETSTCSDGAAAQLISEQPISAIKPTTQTASAGTPVGSFTTGFQAMFGNAAFDDDDL